MKGALETDKVIPAARTDLKYTNEALRSLVWTGTVDDEQYRNRCILMQILCACFRTGHIAVSLARQCEYRCNRRRVKTSLSSYRSLAEYRDQWTREIQRKHIWDSRWHSQQATRPFTLSTSHSTKQTDVCRRRDVTVAPFVSLLPDT